MQRVEVDLGAFAGSGVKLRWRLAADPFVEGSLPGVGWWIDDVTIVDLVEDCRFPPLALDDHAATLRDTPVVIDVVANDSDPNGDPLAVTAVTDPPNGSAAVNGDQTVTYTPDAGFVGSDSFEYTVDDGTGRSDSATVTVSVEEEEPQPTKVTGGGWIPDGSGKAVFGFNAHGEAAPPKGRLTYHAGDGSLKLKGTVTEVVLASATAASFSGPCERADGTACSYRVTVEDQGEPADGDRFAIEVFDGLGSPLHAAGDLLEGGNIQIH